MVHESKLATHRNAKANGIDGNLKRFRVFCFHEFAMEGQEVVRKLVSLVDASARLES